MGMSFLLNPASFLLCVLIFPAEVFGGGGLASGPFHEHEVRRPRFAWPEPCALHVAVEQGDLHLVMELLKDPEVAQSVQAHYICSCLSFNPVLSIAAGSGNVAMVRVLLDAGAPVNVAFGSEALYYAAQEGYEAVVALLIERGARIDGCVMRDAPLHAAAGAGHVGVVRQMLEAGARVDVRDMDVRTPLHDAAGNGHVEVVEVLLAAGADPVWMCWTGYDEEYTPLDVARSQARRWERMTLDGVAEYRRWQSAVRGSAQTREEHEQYRKEMVRRLQRIVMLLEAAERRQKMREAMQERVIALVGQSIWDQAVAREEENAMLEAGMHLLFGDADDLEGVIQARHPEALFLRRVDLLWELFWEQAMCGDRDLYAGVPELFGELGFDDVLEADDGEARIATYSERVQALEAEQRRIQTAFEEDQEQQRNADREWRQAMREAEYDEAYAGIKDLFERDALLLEAIMARNVGEVRRLIAVGADVNTTDPDGATPLHYAAGIEHGDIVEALLGAGADPTRVYIFEDGEARSPLQMAQYQNEPGNLECCEDCLREAQRVLAMLEAAALRWRERQRAMREAAYEMEYAGVRGLFEEAVVEVTNGTLIMELNAPGDGFGEYDDDGEVRKSCHRPVYYGSSSW